MSGSLWENLKPTICPVMKFDATIHPMMSAVGAALFL